MQRRSTEAPVVYALHGWEVRAYEQVVSTMDFAHELVAGRRSAIVVARSQTAGRGSHGRQWLSQIGGLYLSWAFPGAEEPETLLAVFAVAAIDVLVLHGLLGCRIQRPNAIHVGGKKIAGLLAESGNGGCVLGLGVNLNTKCPRRSR